MNRTGPALSFTVGFSNKACSKRLAFRPVGTKIVKPLGIVALERCSACGYCACRCKHWCNNNTWMRVTDIKQNCEFNPEVAFDPFRY